MGGFSGYTFVVKAIQEEVDSNGHSVSLTFSLPSNLPAGTCYLIIANPIGATSLTKFTGQGGTVLTHDQILAYKYPSDPTYPTPPPEPDPDFPFQNGGYQVTLGTGQSVTAEYIFSGASASGDMYIGLWSLSGNYTWAHYHLAKQGCNAISIDSRKWYGQPNTAGELPANQLDPNVPMRNVNFNGWTFNGGLFVGHAPTYTQDESGTARIQAYVTPITSGTPIASCITMYWLSNPTKYTDPYTLQAYSPDPSDPNYNFSPWTNAVWSNGWNLSLPHVSKLGSAAMNTTFLPNSYFNIPILGAATNGNKVMPVALAMNPEPAPGSSPQTWSYFVTPAYEAQVPSVTDKEPRAWITTLPKAYAGSFSPTTSTTSTSTTSTTTTGGSTGTRGDSPTGPTSGE